MSRRIPEYLRLHVEANDESAKAIAPFQSLRTAFSALTGWQIAIRSSDWTEPLNARRAAGSSGSGRSSKSIVQLIGEVKSEDDVRHACAHEVANRFVRALNEVFVELESARENLRCREAELAAGVPIVCYGDQDQHLADRIDFVLKSGAEAIGCHAAALYLLDEGTTELKLRACWGLPKQRLVEPARALRDQLPDLEAMLGHAVVLEDTSLLPNWAPPEDYAAAVCVPVASDSNPLGTLWFFCEYPREFSEQQTNLAEIIAGRIVSDLEREMLLNESLQKRDLEVRESSLVRRQANYFPQVPLLVEGWDVAGTAGESDTVRGDFFDWSVLHDGTPTLAVCNADGPGWESFQTATMTFTALKSHANYSHDSRQMLERLNETMWTGSAGDQLASMFYCRLVGPGEVEYGCAGDIVAFIVKKSGIDLLEGETFPVGSGPDTKFLSHRRRLTKKEVLVVTPLPPGKRDAIAKAEWIAGIAQVVRRHDSATAAQLIEAVREHNHSPTSQRLAEGTILVARRKD